jgi:hypothetical protein
MLCTTSEALIIRADMNDMICGHTNMTWLIETVMVPAHGRRDIKKNHGVNFNLTFVCLVLHRDKLFMNFWRGHLFRVAFPHVNRIRPENIALGSVARIDRLSTLYALVRHGQLITKNCQKKTWDGKLE